MKIGLIFFTVLSIVFADDCKNDISAGSVDIIVDGVKVQLPVVQSGGTSGSQPPVIVNGSMMSLTHGARVYVAANCDEEFKPSTFQSFPLLDKTISYTADLSAVGCACNAALYLVSMPAVNVSGQQDPTKCKDYYCDANQVCGIYCPEIDLFEANNANIHITPHSCDNPTSAGYYDHCDGGGYSLSAYSRDPLSFGPSSSHLIDTTKPFTVTHTFESGDNGKLAKMTNVLSQGDKTYKMVHDKASYLNPLTDAVMSGMTITMSAWGDGGSEMSWLDVPPCDISVACDTKGMTIFGNIVIS